ncbi:hypothetical protein J6590_046132 [Homalodisca vitripennis]|nr:hypothetical protein J6590_046132 [Homalodisca vitripennis]
MADVSLMIVPRSGHRIAQVQYESASRTKRNTDLRLLLDVRVLKNPDTSRFWVSSLQIRTNFCRRRYSDIFATGKLNELETPAMGGRSGGRKLVVGSLHVMARRRKRGTTWANFMCRMSPQNATGKEVMFNTEFYPLALLRVWL